MQFHIVYRIDVSISSGSDQRYNLGLSSARAGINSTAIVTIYFLESLFFDFPIQRLVESLIIHYATREILTHESLPLTTERNVFRAAKTRVLVLFAYTYVALPTKHFARSTVRRSLIKCIQCERKSSLSKLDSFSQTILISSHFSLIFISLQFLLERFIYFFLIELVYS